MSAWRTFRILPRRLQVLVVVAAPLWLPVAFCAWLERGAVRAVSADSQPEDGTA